MKLESFYAANLKSLYGGWVLYRNGEFFARSFDSKTAAKSYAKEFCRINGFAFSWTN